MGKIYIVKSPGANRHQGHRLEARHLGRISLMPVDRRVPEVLCQSPLAGEDAAKRNDCQTIFQVTHNLFFQYGNSD
jgi:hypothetical protein